MARCATCDKPIEAHSGAGQPRRYCSDACKQRAYRQAYKARRKQLLSRRPENR